jgi:hypothetical protein
VEARGGLGTGRNVQGGNRWVLRSFPSTGPPKFEQLNPEKFPMEAIGPWTMPIRHWLKIRGRLQKGGRCHHPLSKGDAKQMCFLTVFRLQLAACHWRVL